MNNLIEIVPFSKTNIFSLEQATQMKDLLDRITSHSKKELTVLNSKLEFQKNNSEKTNMIQESINHELQSWSDKVRRLGCIPVTFGKVRMKSEEKDYFWEPNKLFQF